MDGVARQGRHWRWARGARRPRRHAALLGLARVVESLVGCTSGAAQPEGSESEGHRSCFRRRGEIPGYNPKKSEMRAGGKRYDKARVASAQLEG